MVAGVPGADSDYVQDAVELRAHVARSMQGRAETITTDAMAVQAFAGMGNVAPADRTRLADVIFQLITLAVREGPLDSRSAPVADLEQLMREADIDVRFPHQRGVPAGTVRSRRSLERGIIRGNLRTMAGHRANAPPRVV